MVVSVPVVIGTLWAVTVLAALAAAAGLAGWLTPARSEGHRELVAVGRP